MTPKNALLALLSLVIGAAQALPAHAGPGVRAGAVSQSSEPAEGSASRFENLARRFDNVAIRWENIATASHVSTESAGGAGPSRIVNSVNGVDAVTQAKIALLRAGSAGSHMSAYKPVDGDCDTDVNQGGKAGRSNGVYQREVIVLTMGACPASKRRPDREDNQ